MLASANFSPPRHTRAGRFYDPREEPDALTGASGSLCERRATGVPIAILLCSTLLSRMLNQRMGLSLKFLQWTPPRMVGLAREHVSSRPRTKDIRDYPELDKLRVSRTERSTYLGKSK